MLWKDVTWAVLLCPAVSPAVTHSQPVLSCCTLAALLATPTATQPLTENNQ